MGIAPGPHGGVAHRDELRLVFGAMATGVTVVTVGGGQPHGMTANSFTTVSLDPPLVLVCVDRTALMHELLTSARAFGVSVLAGHQERQARYFADRRRPLGHAQFEHVDWHPAPLTGVPLLTGAQAHLECEVWRRYDGGDHTIVLGSPVWLESRPDGGPLLFWHSRFGQLDHHPNEVTTP